MSAPPKPLVQDYRITPMDPPIGVHLPEQLDWTVKQVSRENLVDRKGSEVRRFRHWLVGDVYVRITPPKRKRSTMGKLNAPREIPYEFRVVLYDFVVWLYDNSERTYLCTATPSVWMEALYHFLPEEGAECPGCKSGTISYNEDRDEATCTGECGSIWGRELPDPDYFGEGALQSEQNWAVSLARVEVAFDVPKKDAWDSAREAANANHLI